MTGAIVELRDVFCVHRTGQGDAAALQGAGLHAQAGEVLCVLGPSGAGKTTLLRVIAGLQTPSAGVVHVMGTDVGRCGERARAAVRHRHLGFLGQSSESVLPPDLSVARAVELPLLLRANLDRPRREARVVGLLDRVGLGERAAALPRELSGGERQRVALCVAIVHRPTLLLADEPTGELDQANAEVILRLIGDLATSERMSVIIATHDPATARFADRTVTISGGRIAEESRGGHDTVVVSATGWMRIPPRLRAGAGIGDRATTDSRAGAVILRPAGKPRQRPAPERQARLHPGPLTPAQVEFRDVDFGYDWDRSVLTGMSHDFAPGQMTAITGRSGSGKSTLLRLAAGLGQPDRGEVIVAGNHLTALDREQIASVRRRCIGYMSQEPTAIAFLSPLENLVLVQQIRGVGLGEAAATATLLIDALDLTERSSQLVSRLSAGETQRVALGRALASSRALLVLDEPTSRLDEANAQLVAGLLAQARRAGHTVICATHDPGIIAEADEVLALDEAFEALGSQR
jgi:ABC-type lipoprotein export system ATPase subunit